MLRYTSSRCDPASFTYALLTAPLLYKPSQKVLYSDLGYRILGHVLEKVGGGSLQSLMKTYIFDPLDMSSTSYRPMLHMPAKSDRFVGTAWSSARGRYLRGEVQDETDYDIEENTGTAEHGHLTGCDGLFSTAEDLAKFAQMLLNRGVHVRGLDLLCNPILSLCPAERVIWDDFDAMFGSIRAEEVNDAVNLSLMDVP